ncbi:hypothetical protein FKM82_023563 [Ascaphus truei]
MGNCLFLQTAAQPHLLLCSCFQIRAGDAPQAAVFPSEEVEESAQLFRMSQAPRSHLPHIHFSSYKHLGEWAEERIHLSRVSGPVDRCCTSSHRHIRKVGIHMQDNGPALLPELGLCVSLLLSLVTM